MSTSTDESPLAGADAAPAWKNAFCLPLSLGMATFLSAIVFITPPPFFPAMSRDLGVSVPALGQIMALMLFTAAALSLLVGPLADRHGLRRLLLVGASGAAACLLAFGIAPSFWFLVAAALFGGLANATLPGLALAVARAYLEGADRQRAIGWAAAGAAVSAIGAVPVMTVLSGLVGWRGAFTIAAAASAAMIGVLVAYLPADRNGPASPPAQPTLLAAYAPLLRHRPTLHIYGTTLLRSVAWFGLLGYFGALMGDHLGLAGSWTGLAYLLSGTGYLVGSLTAEKLFTWVTPRQLIASTNIAIAMIVVLTFGLVSDAFGAVALLTVAGLVGGLSNIGTITELSLRAPGGSGTVMVLNGALTSLGSAGGSAVGGLLLATGGYPTLGIGLAVFSIGAVLLVARSSATAAATTPAQVA